MRVWQNSQPIEDTREYSLAEVATGLGVHYQTVLDWINSGKLVARRRKATHYRYRVLGSDIKARLAQANTR